MGFRADCAGRWGVLKEDRTAEPMASRHALSHFQIADASMSLIEGRPQRAMAISNSQRRMLTTFVTPRAVDSVRRGRGGR